MQEPLSFILPVLLFTLLLAAIFSIEFIQLLRFFIQRLKKQPTQRILTSRGMIINHILCLIALVCLLYGYFIEPYRLEVVTVRLETDKLVNTSLRIVQISDLHCEGKVRLEPRLAGIINPLNPDLVVFTGDAINSPAGLDLFRKTLTGLNASIGKFAVTGNWDTKRMTDLDRFAGTGFEVLNQDVRFLEKDGETFCIAGLGYMHGPHSGPVITKLKPEFFTVFLFHTPDFIVWLKDLPIDLYLCGHTHGGQVALPVWGAITTMSMTGKSFERGLNQYGPITMYTNRGIGLDGGWLPRVRFLARPEITVFDIIPRKAKQ
ncbi:metallophosphoesterase [Anaerohalosphaeraceae bacterium U12dextr]